MSRTTRSWVGTLALLGLLIIGAAVRPVAVASQPPSRRSSCRSRPWSHRQRLSRPRRRPSRRRKRRSRAATLAPTETPEPEPTATVTEAPAAAPVANDLTNCIACHTSEETLQKLAVEEKPAESLSEGEG